MNQGFAGLFSVLLLLTVVFIGTGVAGSELWKAKEEIQTLNSTITRLNDEIAQQDVEIQALQSRLNEEMKAREAAEGQVGELNGDLDEYIRLLAEAQTERDRLAQQVQNLTVQLADAEEQLRISRAASGFPSTGDAPNENAPRSASPLDLIESDPLMVGATWMVIFFSGALTGSVMMFINRRIARSAPAAVEQPAAPGAPHGGATVGSNGRHPRTAKGNQQAEAKTGIYGPGKKVTAFRLVPVEQQPENNKGGAGQE